MSYATTFVNATDYTDNIDKVPHNLTVPWPAGVAHNPSTDLFLYSVGSDFTIDPYSHIFVINYDTVYSAPRDININLPIIDNLQHGSKIYLFYVEDSHLGDTLTFSVVTGSGNTVNGSPTSWFDTQDGGRALYIACGFGSSWLIKSFGNPTNLNAPSPIPMVQYLGPQFTRSDSNSQFQNWFIGPSGTNMLVWVPGMEWYIEPGGVAGPERTFICHKSGLYCISGCSDNQGYGSEIVLNRTQLRLLQPLNTTPDPDVPWSTLPVFSSQLREYDNTGTQTSTNIPITVNVSYLVPTPTQQPIHIFMSGANYAYLREGYHYNWKVGLRLDETNPYTGGALASVETAYISLRFQFITGEEPSLYSGPYGPPAEIVPEVNQLLSMEFSGNPEALMMSSFSGVPIDPNGGKEPSTIEPVNMMKMVKAQEISNQEPSISVASLSRRGSTPGDIGKFQRKLKEDFTVRSKASGSVGRVGGGTGGSHQSSGRTDVDVEAMISTMVKRKLEEVLKAQDQQGGVSSGSASSEGFTEMVLETRPIEHSFSAAPSRKRRRNAVPGESELL